MIHDKTVLLAGNACLHHGRGASAHTPGRAPVESDVAGRRAQERLTAGPHLPPPLPSQDDWEFQLHWNVCKTADAVAGARYETQRFAPLVDKKT